MTSKSRSGQRLSAQARQSAIIEAAVGEFGRKGYAGGSTEAISRAVGISQPYLFKLFGTKKQLFLAAYDHVWDVFNARIVAAVRQQPDEPIAALRVAYQELAGQQDAMLLTLQAYTAAADPDIREAVRERESRAFAEAMALSGASPAEVRHFFAESLLLTVGLVLDLPEYIR